MFSHCRPTEGREARRLNLVKLTLKDIILWENVLLFYNDQDMEFAFDGDVYNNNMYNMHMII